MRPPSRSPLTGLCPALLVAVLGTACSSDVDRGSGAPAETGQPTEAVPMAAAPVTHVQFEDVTQRSGLDFEHTSGTRDQPYILESMSAGGAFLDYDGDGYLDVFLVNATRWEAGPAAPISRLYRNSGKTDGDGGGEPSFQDVTDEAGVGHSGWGMGCAVGDYDNDGDVDLYITQWGANVLYRNEGRGSFLDVSEEAGVDDDGWGSSAAFGDIDADGHLDLYVANYLEFDIDDPPGEGLPCSGWKGLDVYCGPMGMEPQTDVLYRNGGDGRFTDVTSQTEVAAHKRPALGVAFGDYDDDGDQDIYVANDSEPNLLFRNDGEWQLREVGTLAGSAYSEDGRAQAGMGIASGDFDNDGDLDLFVTNFSDDVNTLYRNLGTGSFRDATAAAGLDGSVRPFLGWSTAFFDADNDGWLDLFVANGHIYPQVDIHPSGIRYAQRNLMYRNVEGVFHLVAAAQAGLGEIKVSRGAAFGDYDNDGDIDVLVMNLNDTPTLLKNRGADGGNWIGLHLIGEASNRDALGARVRVFAEGQGGVQLREVQSGYGYQSQHDRRALFGLGGQQRVQRVEIAWPSGHVQIIVEPPTGRYLVVREGVEVAYESSYGGSSSPGAARVSAEPAEAESEPSLHPRIDAHADWSAEDHYRAGVELYKQGRYEEALEAMRPAIGLRADYMEALYALGVVLYGGLGRPAEAMHFLEEAARIDSASATVRKLLGTVYLSLNQNERAQQVLKAAASLDPDDWDGRNQLGLAQTRLGDLAAAGASFRQAALRAPWEPHPHLNLAQTYRRLGYAGASARESAIFDRLEHLRDDAEYYQTEVERDTSAAEPHFQLGRAYFLQGRTARALPLFRRALELAPDYGLARYGLGAALHSTGNLEGAIEAYRSAYQHDPNLAMALSDLGRAYHEAGKLEEAIAAYREALRKHPGLAMARSNLGDLYASQGRAEDAIAQYRAALDADPTLVSTQNALFGVYATEGRIDEARREWKSLIGRAPRRVAQEGSGRELIFSP